MENEIESLRNEIEQLKIENKELKEFIDENISTLKNRIALIFDKMFGSPNKEIQ